MSSAKTFVGIKQKTWTTTDSCTNRNVASLMFKLEKTAIDRSPAK